MVSDYSFKPYKAEPKAEPVKVADKARHHPEPVRLADRWVIESYDTIEDAQAAQKKPNAE